MFARDGFVMRRLSEIICDQQPLTMPEASSVKVACQQMRDTRAGSVLVTDDAGSLIGIFTGRDAVCRVLAAGKIPARTTLGQVMTPDPISMSPDKKAIDALRLMWDRNFRHVPVTENGKALGVVSRGDFEGVELDRLEMERHLSEHIR